MKSSDLVLALDIGTSSLRASLFDARGRRVPGTTTQIKYQLHTSVDGAAELPVSVLEKAAVHALRGTLLAQRQHRTMRTRAIVAVGTSCFWHSLLGYDAAGGRTTPVFTWADARCREDARRLRSRVRESTYHARTGSLLRTPYWPAKLRWLHRVGLAHGITHWMSPAEWLAARLIGRHDLSLSMASGTGLLNLRTNQWDNAMLRTVPVRRESLGEITGEGRTLAAGPGPLGITRLPWPSGGLRDALWFPAIGDGAASNLGSDATLPGRAALNLGTSGAVRLILSKVPKKIPNGLFCHRVDAQRCLLGGAISNAGNLRAWALRELGLPKNPAQLERALAARQQPSSGLHTLPFFTGERSPTWPDAVGGTITGLTYQTTALDLMQALVESSYQRLAQIVDRLQEASPQPLDIVVSGGVHDSPQSMQRLANVFGRPIRSSTEPEASLRGAALFALHRLGQKTELLTRGKPIAPHPAPAQLFARLRRTQAALEARLAPPLKD